VRTNQGLVSRAEGIAHERVPPEGGSPEDSLISSVAEDMGLSRRQAYILVASIRGRVTKDIASSLGISTKTVEAHWARMFKKLGCGSKVQALGIVVLRICAKVLRRS
jgi:DNA-binding CsgD family transcriptional regulator